MFAYDCTNDEYKQVFENRDKCEIPKGGGFSAIVVSSRRSSLRSLPRNNQLTASHRVIGKNGRLNSHLSKVGKKLNYLKDWGNTLVNIRWRWILITLCTVNLLTFSLFTGLWMWMAKVSGDFDKKQQEEKRCVVNAHNVAGYFLLSVETVMTIGYGHRYPTEYCVHGWLVQTLQAVMSVLIQGMLVSAVYVKISRPFTKHARSLFASQAVICLRDGNLCLMVRIIDPIGKVSIGTNITMYYVDKDSSPTASNEDDSFTSAIIKQIKIERYGLLIFPLEIVHVIDSESPLWKMTPAQLLIKRFEIIVVAEGTSMVTAQLSHNRTSYVNADIWWGHRFCACVDFEPNTMKYAINHSLWNKTIPIDTPLCSAAKLHSYENQEKPPPHCS